MNFQATMRYLGIDYGSKRIGIAVSDEEGRIAFPHSVIDGGDQREAIKKIKNIAQDRAAVTIIIGLPMSFSGTKTAQTRSVETFANTLADEVQLPVEFENEILSSRMGERAGVPRKYLDASAAAIILQSYLDKHK